MVINTWMCIYIYIYVGVGNATNRDLLTIISYSLYSMLNTINITANLNLKSNLKLPYYIIFTKDRFREIYKIC